MEEEKTLRPVLIDTSALLALANPRDQYHTEAARIAKRHLSAGGQFLGTVMVLGEFHAHLLYLTGPVRARTVVSSLIDDTMYSWIDVSAELVAAAVSAWLERFRDRRFSLIDAVSFQIMRRDRIQTAFAFDRHFRTAGFGLLK
jgi:predicted nucleic acid-binding protein